MRKLLFVVEGNTDIRFVDGLSRHFDLTLLVPAAPFQQSGLKQRIHKLGLTLTIYEIGGGRFSYQGKSFLWLLSRAKQFDVILAQEMLRGALSATLAGWLCRVPVATMVGIPAVEYFDCRFARHQISWLKWQLGRTFIKFLLRVNGKLARAGFGMGEYHQNYIRPYVKKSLWASYYGVNLEKFRPATALDKKALRAKLRLPEGFLVLSASRVSHEKDPETFLAACHKAREAGVPIHVLNLGGGFEDFVKLGEKIAGPTSKAWINGRSAIHPMEDLADYYRCCDVLVQSSLFEGVAYCTMEALACELPVIATAVGGMKAQLGPYATLVPVRDPMALHQALIDVYEKAAVLQMRAAQGKKWVGELWESEKGFRKLERDLSDLIPGTAKIETTPTISTRSTSG